MDLENKSEHIKTLSQEILDDIELGRAPADSILLKATRLCRLTESATYREWLKYEMSGYNSGTEIALEFMVKTGRWIDKEKNQGHPMFLLSLINLAPSHLFRFSETLQSACRKR